MDDVGEIPEEFRTERLVMARSDEGAGAAVVESEFDPLLGLGAASFSSPIITAWACAAEYVASVEPDGGVSTSSGSSA